MRSIGFNITKGRLWYCVLEGSRVTAELVYHSYEKFDVEQPHPLLTNYFKQAFKEVVEKHKPDIIAYRMSLEGKKKSIPYLYFSFGVLNLLAHELEMPIFSTISQTFSAKALGARGDKFAVCDQLIAAIPAIKWNNDYRYAALAAWISMDG